MYKVKFNSQIIATASEEKAAMEIALGLHTVSNIAHMIFVEKDEENIIFFKQCSDCK